MKSVCACLLLVSLLLPQNCLGQEFRLAGKAPKAAAAQLRTIISHAGSKGLSALQNDPDTSLALQAAWLLALGPGDEKVPPCPKQFVRFFETRTGLKVPLRWEYNLAMNALEYSHDGDRLQAAAQKEEYLPSCDFLVKEPGKGRINYRRLAMAKYSLEYSPDRDEYPAQVVCWWAPVGTRIEGKNGKFVIKIENATVEIREADVPRDALGHCPPACSAHIGPKRSFIVFHETAGHGSFFSMLCVDSRSGEILWRRKVWGTAINGGAWAGTVPSQELMLVTKKDQIVLFGMGTDVFVEAFDSKSGTPVFRFCTKHWFDCDSGDLSLWRRGLWSFWWRVIAVGKSFAG